MTNLISFTCLSWNDKVAIREQFCLGEYVSPKEREFTLPPQAAANPPGPNYFKWLPPEDVLYILNLAGAPVQTSEVCWDFCQLSNDRTMRCSLADLFPNQPRNLPPAQLQNKIYQSLNQELKDLGLNSSILKCESEPSTYAYVDRVIKARNFCLVCSRLPGVAVDLSSSPSTILAEASRLQTLLQNELNNPLSIISSMETLDLKQLNLTRLPSEIGNFRRVNNLNLDQNKLSTLPSEIGNLQALRSLSVNHNTLTTLPPQITSLRRLGNLSLNHNHLTTLPSDIGSLRQMVFLDLSHNSISQIPSSIGTLGLLGELRLSHNCLKTLPQEITHLHNLMNLHLSNNSLTALPPGLETLGRLDFVDVSYNCLPFIPAQFFHLPGAQASHFRHNPLSFQQRLRIETIGSSLASFF